MASQNQPASQPLMLLLLLLILLLKCTYLRDTVPENIAGALYIVNRIWVEEETVH